MSELKLSVTVLVSYIIAVLGVANIEFFQTSVIDFSPVFFILMALAVFSELIVVGALIKQGVRISNYMFIIFWAVVYVLVWVFYWKDRLHIQVQIIQFLLVELSAGLAYDVGKRVGQMDNAMEGLAFNAYPNRTKELQSAEHIINDELTRTRRYHHTLPILAVRLEKTKGGSAHEHYELLGDDILERFANAKIGNILSDLSRSTDIILRDRDGLFIIVCPETEFGSVSILANRIADSVNRKLGKDISWGSALFPDEALTFEELLQTARNRLRISENRNTEEVEISELTN